MDKTIEKAIEEAEKKAKEVELMKALTEEFPDLKIHTNRWGHKRYSAKSANTRVDKFDYGFNCGCCNDSPLEIWPYLETMGVKVHSDPTGIMVGERCDWGNNYRAVYAWTDWEEKFTKHGISQTIIEGVQHHLELVAPKDYEDDEDEDEE